MLKQKQLAIAALLGLAFALIATRTGFRHKKALRILTVLPIITPPFVIGLGLILIFGRSGLINQLLEYLFGWQAGTGLAYELTQRVTLMAGYRYIDLGQPKVTLRVPPSEDPSQRRPRPRRRSARRSGTAGTSTRPPTFRWSRWRGG